MNAINIPTIGLSSSSLKFRGLLLKTFWRKNQFLLPSSSCSEPHRTKKRHFSQIQPASYALLLSNKPRHLDSLIFKHSGYLHLFPLRPSSFNHWKNFSNDHLRITDRQDQDKGPKKITEKKAEVDSNLARNGAVNDSKGEPVKKLTLYQRFKSTYKEHGKVLVAVHLLTSAVWFGTFYTVARCGVDVIPMMESLSFSERIISPFRSGSLGDIAVAYLMYKLATPARYTVTIGGTNLAIRYLRREGKIPHMTQEDTIRALYKEGKESFKRRSRVHFRRLRRKHKIKLRVMHTREKH